MQVFGEIFLKKVVGLLLLYFARLFIDSEPVKRTIGARRHISYLIKMILRLATSMQASEVRRLNHFATTCSITVYHLNTA